MSSKGTLCSGFPDNRTTAQTPNTFLDQIAFLIKIVLFPLKY